jgi:hypothetical protein
MGLPLSLVGVIVIVIGIGIGIGHSHKVRFVPDISLTFLWCVAW